MAGTKNDTLIGANADFSQTGGPNAASSSANGLNTNGQMWIGSTITNAGGTHINVGTITSPDSSITFGYSSPNITATVTGGTTSVIKLTGNSGIATPTAGNINVITANATVKFVGAASTLTQDFGLSNLIMGTNLVGTATGTFNVGVGLNTIGANVTNGSSNTGVGLNSLKVITSGSSNSSLGVSCGAAINSGSNNVCVGSSALSSLTSGNSNIGIGNSPLSGLLTGSQNVAIGTNSTGSTYNGAESSNILMQNAGTNGESHVIRIGTQGSGTAQQNQCFIAGIVGVTNSNPQTVSINSSTGQLGVTNGTVAAWSVITADQTAVVNNGYICNKASALLLTLPATASIGDIIRVTGINTALGWKIVQNANQQIFFGASSTTLGATGFLQSSATRDSVELICVVSGASTVYNVISSVGNITVA